MGYYEEIEEIIEKNEYRNKSIKSLNWSKKYYQEKIDKLNEKEESEDLSYREMLETQIYREHISAIDKVMVEKREKRSKKKEKREKELLKYVEEHPPLSYSSSYETVFSEHIERIIDKYDIDGEDKIYIDIYLEELNEFWKPIINYKSDISNEENIPIEKVIKHPDYSSAIGNSKDNFKKIMKIYKKYGITKNERDILGLEFRIFITPNHLYGKWEELKEKRKYLDYRYDV